MFLPGGATATSTSAVQVIHYTEIASRLFWISNVQIKSSSSKLIFLMIYNFLFNYLYISFCANSPKCQFQFPFHSISTAPAQVSTTDCAATLFAQVFSCETCFWPKAGHKSNYAQILYRFYLENKSQHFSILHFLAKNNFLISCYPESGVWRLMFCCFKQKS